MKIRERFIQKKVLDFYRSLPSDLVSLPLNVMQITKTLHNVRMLTYREFAKIYSLSVMDVARYAESDDGATHYKRSTNQYIILYNDEVNTGRQRFTIAHELGHVVLGHLVTIAACQAAANNVFNTTDPIIERESDWFASMLLCPFPVLRQLDIRSPSQIQKLCGLSTQASVIKHEQYTEWCRYHHKTAWENDMLRLFSGYISETGINT